MFAGYADRMAATNPPPVIWQYAVPPTELDMEAPHLSVYLVIYEWGGIGWTGTDRNRAHEFARHAHSVVARLPVVGDYRRERNDGS